MNLRRLFFLGTGLLTLAGFSSLHGQQYAVDWSTIDGGGGISTGDGYSITGTIGQPDAGTMSGGSFALAGGFWGIIAAVQNPRAPVLTAMRTVTNSLVVSWPLPDEGWRLQATTSIFPTPLVWTEIVAPCSTNATSLYFTELVPAGNKFYRLHKP